jgi:hypothetical protein
MIIDGWGEKEELKPEKKGNHTTNYREVSVTGTETYTPVPLSSYDSYSLFSTGTGTVTSNHTFTYGTSGRRIDE